MTSLYWQTSVQTQIVIHIARLVKRDSVLGKIIHYLEALQNDAHLVFYYYVHLHDLSQSFYLLPGGKRIL